MDYEKHSWHDPCPEDAKVPLEPGTHCPANKAADLIGDRWVLQIIRAMMMGATRYGELQQAIPRISPAMLSQRLKRLADDGLIVRRESASSKSASYRLTPSGRELEPIVRFLAEWGLRWASRNVREANVDIGALMWDVHRSLRTRELPDGETVIGVTLPDAENYPKWWIIANGRKVDLCSDNPGKDVDVYLTCPVQSLIDIWRGEADVRACMEDGTVMLDGPSDLVGTVDRWFPVSPVAASR